jgi:hypothetical protein
LGEGLRAELLCPGGLHFADRLADHADRGGSSSREDDAFGAQVIGIRSALEGLEALELAEEVVEGLFADPQPRGQFGRPGALRSGVLEDVQVRRVEVVEAAGRSRSAAWPCCDPTRTCFITISWRARA